ncbi:MAG: hypothetical protein ACRD1L_05530 [Terriglobales bacterium]
MLSGPHGAESGTIAVAAWGADHCKVTITLGPPVLRRSYTAVMNGKRAVVTAPADMAATAPLPVSPQLGCALLPAAIALDKLAGASASLSLDAGGRPLALNWTARGQPVSLSYSNYQSSGGQPQAGTVIETVGGKVRLQVQFTSVAPQTFTDGDFVLPPQPSLSSRPGGGL